MAVVVIEVGGVLVVDRVAEVEVMILVVVVVVVVVVAVIALPEY